MVNVALGIKSGRVFQCIVASIVCLLYIVFHFTILHHYRFFLAHTQSPKIKLKGRYRFSCEIKINDLSSTLEWNGISLGYEVFYERRAKLSDELFGNFDMEKASRFQARHVPHGNASVWLSNLKVYSEYVVYIGARNSAGVGPVSRLVFRTKPGGEFWFFLNPVKAPFEHPSLDS